MFVWEAGPPSLEGSVQPVRPIENNFPRNHTQGQCVAESGYKILVLKDCKTWPLL